MYLRQILDRVRRGNFTKSVIKFAASKSRGSRKREDYYQFLSLKSDLLDQFGQYEPARDLLCKPCEKLIHEFAAASRKPSEWSATLPGNPKLNYKVRKWWRQKVWCCLHYSLSLYRFNNLKEAQRYLSECERFVHKCLQTPQFSCNGTLCRLSYFRALIYRQTRDLRADEEFTKSIEYARRRLEGRSASDNSWTEVQFAHTCVGKNFGFGYGSLASHRGNYSQARKYFHAASILLHGTMDRLLWAHLQIVSSSCRRKELGPDLKLKSEVVEPLAAAFSEAEGGRNRLPHRPYAALAAYEIGMSYYYLALLGTVDKAQYIETSLVWHAKMVENSGKSDILAVEAMILSSRIHWLVGKNADALLAFREATKRLNAVQDSRKSLPGLWARILVCEAEVDIDVAERFGPDTEERGDCIRRALEDLDRAVKLGSDLPLTNRVASFHRARCAYLNGDEMGSLYGLARIDSEHGWLNRQVREMTEQIQQHQGLFVIRFEKNRDLRHYLEILEPWVAREMRGQLLTEGIYKDLSGRVAERLDIPLGRVQHALGSKPGRPPKVPIPWPPPRSLGSHKIPKLSASGTNSTKT